MMIINIINMKSAMPKEIKILNEFLAGEKLRPSRQREIILRQFLSIERHITAEELYDILKKKNPAIGFATVHRNLKLFSRCGLARGVSLGDRKTHYEHIYKHKHHDHLICRKCGRTSEFFEPTIEKLQKGIAGKFDFTIENHTLQIYGLCRRCNKGVSRTKGDLGGQVNYKGGYHDWQNSFNRNGSE